MRVIHEEDLRSVATEAVALEAAERAFAALASGRARQPPPLSLELPEVRGEVYAKGAALDGALALLEDGGYLTELRTGAAGALAVRLLAPGRIERMALIGTGVQARFQLRAVVRVREPEEADGRATS